VVEQHLCCADARREKGQVLAAFAADKDDVTEGY
jgi:hypothetical protein